MLIRLEEQALHPTPTGAVVEFIWYGKCVNDIVRPDGQIVAKAKGQEFTMHVCTVVEVNEEGKTTRVDDYYNKVWEDGIPQAEYVVMKGASIKVPADSKI